MLQLTTENLLGLTVYGTPSGNYDGTSPDFIGNAFPAASFYGGQGGTQTAAITVDGFVGIITFQATLNDLAGQANWFDLESYGDGINPLTETTALTFPGNFVFVRAAVTEFSAGQITSVSLLY